MIDKEIIAYFKAAHGFFNLCMLGLFSFQAWMGYQIRQARESGAPVPFDAVRRHRKAGPVFALWGALGFIAGIVMTILDRGRIFHYPLHFLGGAMIVMTIAALAAVSQRITGPDRHHRNVHFGLGVFLLSLYVVQVLLGIGILL